MCKFLAFSLSMQCCGVSAKEELCYLEGKSQQDVFIGKWTGKEIQQLFLIPRYEASVYASMRKEELCFVSQVVDL